MTERKPTVTRPDFEDLIGRALAIQDRSGERVELDRARAIAMELGVSPEAWDEALEERRLAVESPQTPSAPSAVPQTGAKPFSIAALSAMSPTRLAVIGTLLSASATVVASRLGGIEVPLGAAGLVLGMLLAVEHARRAPAGWTPRLGVWWASISVGMMIGIGGGHPDPIVYGAAGWLTSETVAWFMRRRANTPEPT
jgi:hypothetical protein